MQPWMQIYDPLGNLWLSSLVAALPIIFFFVALAVLRMKGHVAGTITVAIALAVAIFFYKMPVEMALASAGYGFLYGLWPIAWIIIAAVFLYKITVKTGQFDVIRASVVSITDDQRLQMLLVGFSFGAFLEGAAGFGAPVAITAALLVGLGFNPLYAAGLCLIANTAPVAFGAMGIPIIVGGQVTGIDPFKIGQMAGRQLPLLSVHRPVLADRHDGRLARHQGDLARHPGGRPELRRHPVLHRQLHRTGAARHHLRAGQPDLPDHLPEELEAQAHLPFRQPARRRAGCGRSPQLRPDRQGLVALRDPDHHGHPVEPQALQGPVCQGRPPVLAGLPVPGAHARQAGHQDGTHRRQGHPLRRGVQARHPLGHRHRHLPVGPDQHGRAGHAQRRCRQGLQGDRVRTEAPIYSIGMVLAFAFVANYSGLSATLALLLAGTGVLPSRSSRPSWAGWACS
jgi:hypothetical protein